MLLLPMLFPVLGPLEALRQPSLFCGTHCSKPFFTEMETPRLKFLFPPSAYYPCTCLRGMLQKKESPPTVDSTGSHLNKTTVLLRIAHVFKDPADKGIKAVSRALFSLTDHAFYPIFAVILFCQTLAAWAKSCKEHVPLLPLISIYRNI